MQTESSQSAPISLIAIKLTHPTPWASPRAGLLTAVVVGTRVLEADITVI